MALQIFRFTSRPATHALLRVYMPPYIYFNHSFRSQALSALMSKAYTRDYTYNQNCQLHIIYTLIWFIQEQRDNEGDGPPKITVRLPKYITSRWRKFLKSDQEIFEYNISTSVKAANIDKKEFVKCWNFVKSRTMPEEIFSWFKDARFGQITPRPARKSLRVAFIKTILQRYKDIEVCVHMCFPCVIVMVWFVFSCVCVCACVCAYFWENNMYMHVFVFCEFICAAPWS